MWHCWLNFILTWVSMATPIVGQSGDGEWGSGSTVFSVGTNGTLQAVGDDPGRMKDDHHLSVSTRFSPSPSSQSDSPPDECSVHFSSHAAASARRLKAQKEEVAYLKVIQHGNKAMVENMEQFVGSELGGHTYEDLIKENILGIQEDQKGCVEVMEKAEEDLKQQLEGDGVDVFTGMKKIREESLAFEAMLRAAADIASRLERSSQALHAAFTSQLKDTVRILT